MGAYYIPKPTQPRREEAFECAMVNFAGTASESVRRITRYRDWRESVIGVRANKSTSQAVDPCVNPVERERLDRLLAHNVTPRAPEDCSPDIAALFDFDIAYVANEAERLYLYRLASSLSKL